MIMRPGEPLLLPANPWFVAGSLLLALLLNLLLHLGLGTASVWLPDVLALALVFWAVHQPNMVGVGVAFGLGLLMDVHQGAVLGQHALAYAVLGYLGWLIRRRLLWFAAELQALQVLPLLLLAQLLQMLARLALGDGWIGWHLLWGPVLEALLWPVATALLLAPQRRAHNPDDTRPI